MDLASTRKAVQRHLELKKFADAAQLARAEYEAGNGDPDYGAVFATALVQNNQIHEAEEVFREAAAHQKASDLHRCNLAEFLMSQSRYREVLEVANSLEDERMAEVRIVALAELGESQLALSTAEEAIAIHKSSRRLNVHRLLMMLYPSGISEKAIDDAHRLHGQRVESGCRPFPQHFCSKHPHRKLHVGLVSGCYFQHVVSRFLLPLVEAWEDSDLQVTLYSTRKVEDDIRRRFESAAYRIRDIDDLTPEEAAQKMLGDKIDILVDIDGNTAMMPSLIFAFQPAPIQTGYLGFPHPTGLSRVPSYITDRVMTPNDPHAIEGCCLTYRSQDPLPEIATLPDGPITFGSFNNARKISEETLDDWAAVLSALPDSKMICKAVGLDDPILNGRLSKGFESRGIDPARVEWIGHVPTYAEHAATFGRVHIALDASPYNGTTTTIEALLMGVPVLSTLGNSIRSRTSASILNDWHPEWIARDRENLVEIASDLSRSPETLRSHRSQLRNEFERVAVGKPDDLAERLSAHFRLLWIAYCES